jgi:hypothetical protein
MKNKGLCKIEKNSKSNTTGKIGGAVQPIFVVCSRTVKISLLCVRRKTHDKDLGHGNDRHERPAKMRFTATMEESARQWTNVPHGKLHGKVQKASPCTPLPSVFHKYMAKQAFA